MSMSSHIIGFVPPDDEWKKKKAAFDSCKAAGIDPPRELWKFFGECTPDDNGREIDLTPFQSRAVPPKGVTEWGDNSKQGFEIVLAELPPQVKILRFYNAY
jgi:hypothetical protein